MLDIIKKRRSIRKYTEEPISQEDINTILRSALLAPTSRSFESVELVAIQDKETILKLERCKAHSTNSLLTAPLVIAILGNTKATDVWIEDTSIAAISLQYQVEAMGLGSTWIQMRLRQDDKGQSSEELVRKILDIPEHYAVLCLMTIGHKAEQKKPYTDEDAQFRFVHTETFGRKFNP